MKLSDFREKFHLAPITQKDTPARAFLRAVGDVTARLKRLDTLSASIVPTVKKTPYSITPYEMLVLQKEENLAFLNVAKTLISRLYNTLSPEDVALLLLYYVERESAVKISDRNHYSERQFYRRLSLGLAVMEEVLKQAENEEF